MIEADTLVPELDIHSFSLVIPSPRIIEPAVMRSGFMFPTPSSSDQVVMPLDENAATLVRLESKEPIPMTLIRSPGLFKVP